MLFLKQSRAGGQGGKDGRRVWLPQGALRGGKQLPVASALHFSGRSGRPILKERGRMGNVGQWSALMVNRGPTIHPHAVTAKGGPSVRVGLDGITVPASHCHLQESQQLRAHISDTAVVVQMDNSWDPNLDGIVANVKAHYEDTACRSRAETEAWCKGKVRKAARRRMWVHLSSENPELL